MSTLFVTTVVTTKGLVTVEFVSLNNIWFRQQKKTILFFTFSNQNLSKVKFETKFRRRILCRSTGQLYIALISKKQYSLVVSLAAHGKQVLASPTYPVKEWLDMGTFTAKSIHGEQTFELAEPAFARCCMVGCTIL